ncbi:hypothetical protein DYB38_003871, partial [Aphanomyces astaci]
MADVCRDVAGGHDRGRGRYPMARGSRHHVPQLPRRAVCVRHDESPGARNNRREQHGSCVCFISWEQWPQFCQQV